MEFFDLNKLFNWSRLVDPLPDDGWKFLWYAVGICAGLIILAIIRAFIPGDKTLKRKTESMLITVGLIGFLLIFFRYQEIPYFSARLLWLVLVGCALVWIILILYYRQVKLPKIILKQKVEERKKRYI